MPGAGPLKRADLIRYLRILGFGGPYAGARHQIMVRGNITLRIPNPHQGDIGTGLLLRVLKQAGIARAEWERL
ncbi:MAG: type II toxin-antitoxin system HicA family toxin [Bryobacteraceae bacterium]|jgi:predicted RNA binding protein YcfA (HicA-like mRNA interferase family)